MHTSTKLAYIQLDTIVFSNLVKDCRDLLENSISSKDGEQAQVFKVTHLGISSSQPGQPSHSIAHIIRHEVLATCVTQPTATQDSQFLH